MFLVVTSKRDITADFVILEMQRRALSYLRLNTEDLPQAVMDCCPTGDGAWRLQVDHVDFSLASVAAAYFRRPGVPESVPQIQDEGERAYCSQEWSAALNALYWELGERWLNAPHLIFLAENKIRQLRLAHAVGFQVPRTRVTNDPGVARAFAGEDSLVAKPLRSALIGGVDSDRIVFTTRMTLEDFDDPMPVRACPVILQTEIPKRFDIRVTVVGSQYFAATIDSQSDPQTVVDWRVGSNVHLAHSVHELPEEVGQKCIEIVRRMSLRFGAIDLVLDPSGEYWFLEVNPNGQWGWIEKRTGHPIAKAIVSELERIAA